MCDVPLTPPPMTWYFIEPMGSHDKCLCAYFQLLPQTFCCFLCCTGPFKHTNLFLHFFYVHTEFLHLHTVPSDRTRLVIFLLSSLLLALVLAVFLHHESAQFKNEKCITLICFDLDHSSVNPLLEGEKQDQPILPPQDQPPFPGWRKLLFFFS